MAENKELTVAEENRLWRIKTDDGGVVERVKVTFKWKPTDKTNLLVLRRYDKEKGGYVLPDRAFITSAGMAEMNQVAALHILTPPQVVVDGKPRNNPYIERYLLPDGRYGGIKAIYYYTLVIGRAPTGQMVTVDHSFVFSPNAVLMQQIAKLAQYPDACFLGTPQDDPRHNTIEFKTKTRKDKKEVPHKVGGGGRWMYYPIDEMMGYWINPDTPEVQEMMANHVDVVATADRRADTIRRRNALAQHPAFGGKYAELKNGWYVKTIVGWRTGGTLDDAKKIAKAVMEGRAEVLENTQTIKVEETATAVDNDAIVDPELAIPATSTQPVQTVAEAEIVEDQEPEPVPVENKPQDQGKKPDPDDGINEFFGE